MSVDTDNVTVVDVDTDNATAAVTVDEPDDGDGAAMAKLMVMLVLGLGSFALGVAPLKIAGCRRGTVRRPSDHGHGHLHHNHGGTGCSAVVSLLLCFGGGVLLFTTLLHLQPELRGAVGRLQRHGRLPPGVEILADLIFCAGFFMVFLVDEIAHAVLDRNHGATNARLRGSRGSDVLRRSMSLRRRPVPEPMDSTADDEPKDDVILQRYIRLVFEQ